MSLGVNPKTEIRFQKTNVRGKKAEDNIDKDELGSMVDWGSADPIHYDGQKITQTKGGLGIMLGDEGSGASLGKQLVKDYLDDCLPNSIKDKFEKRFKLSADTAKNIIFENVKEESQVWMSHADTINNVSDDFEIK